MPRGGAQQNAGRKSKGVVAAKAAKSDKSQRKINFQRLNAAHEPQAEATQQNENSEQPPPQPDVEGPQNGSESSNEEESRGHSDENAVAGGGNQMKEGIQQNEREINQFYEQMKLFLDGTELDPEDLEEDVDDFQESSKANRKDRMRYQPPPDSILGAYLQRRRIELTCTEEKIATSPRWIASDRSPIFDPCNPANYYSENATIFLHDPVIQYKKQFMKGHREYACVECGSKGTLATHDWHYRPAHHGDSTDWILHRRYCCKGNKKNKGCGKTFASFHADFFKQFPEFVADGFPFVMTDHLGMHESMVHEMLCFSTKGILFGAFASGINEAKKAKYWKQHGCCFENVKRKVMNQQRMLQPTGHLLTLSKLFSPFDKVGDYNGIELRAGLVRLIFIKVRMTLSRGDWWRKQQRAQMLALVFQLL